MGGLHRENELKLLSEYNLFGTIVCKFSKLTLRLRDLWLLKSFTSVVSKIIYKCKDIV